MSRLHPAAYLFLSVVAMVFVQFYHPAPLLLTLTILLLAGKRVWHVFFRFVFRARWLLILLWLFMAYGLPGEPVFSVAGWLVPTYEGLSSANEHVLRLLVIFALLARLFSTLNHPHLLSGLWLICKPLKCFSIDVERAVVRLMLVWDQLEHVGGGKDWRRWLTDMPESKPEPVVFQLEEKPWQRMDTLGLLAGCLLLTVGVMY